MSRRHGNVACAEPGTERASEHDDNPQISKICQKIATGNSRVTSRVTSEMVSQDATLSQLSESSAQRTCGTAAAPESRGALSERPGTRDNFLFHDSNILSSSCFGREFSSRQQQLVCGPQLATALLHSPMRTRAIVRVEPMSESSRSSSCEAHKRASSAAKACCPPAHRPVSDAGQRRATRTSTHAPQQLGERRHLLGVLPPLALHTADALAGRAGASIGANVDQLFRHLELVARDGVPAQGRRGIG